MKLDLETPCIGSSFEDLVAEVEQVALGERPLAGFINDVVLISGLTVSTKDLAAMTTLRGRFSRVLDRIAAMDAGPQLGNVRAVLCAGMWALERAELMRRVELGARRRRAEVQRVRERVLQLLLESPPQSPRMLVDVLGCEPTQLSRALRELEREGAVRQVPAPPGEDHLTRYYTVERV